MPIHRRVLAGLVAWTLWPASAGAVGESVDGFPSYAERVLHQLANRARVDPQLELAGCGSNCGELACYAPAPPLYYRRALNRAARFHAAHQSRNGYFAHESACTLVAGLDGLYPASCAGAASCSCVGGSLGCGPTCTAWNQRVGLFGASASGEIIASPADPSSAFYLWLFERSTSTACSFSSANGHRWLLLKSNGAVGFGSDGDSVGDFSSSGGERHPIASGSHWPRQAASVEAWASYADPTPATAAWIDVGGSCLPMDLARGTPIGGAWQVALQGVGSGCNRYYFVFAQGPGALVTYPDTGSLGIGPAGSCPDWSPERPPLGTACQAVPEPTTALQGAAALAGLALRLRRRRRRAPHAGAGRPLAGA